MKSDIPGQKRKKPQPKKGVNIRWIIMIFLSTVVISAAFSTVSSGVISGANLTGAFLILLLIVLIGIVFDIIGVAVTAADTKPFHSMAAHKAPGAQEALGMLRNAEKVSSFCNDVVGDICGVISGTASASIVLMIAAGNRGPGLWEIVMASVVSGVTVGGKAIGKSLALRQSTQIVHMAALFLYYIRSAPRNIGGFFRRKN